MRVARLYKIIHTLLFFGLDTLVPKKWQPWYFKAVRLCFFWIRNHHAETPAGQKLRLALEHLGPVWIKFGQMLSTRQDLLPVDVAQELALLQDKVPPFEGALAKQIIETALGLNDISECFSEFDSTPLASASIAQVHSAKIITANGQVEEIVIKVIRPDIEPIIHSDLYLMQDLAKLASQFLPDGKRLRPVEVIKEYRKTLLDELDLMREGANAIQLKRNFENSEALYIPYIYSDLSRKNVLVMERIYGIPVSDLTALKAQGTNLELLAERGVQVFFTQVFRDSFFHADMHPGNIFVSYNTPHNPQYIGIDCGIVGTLNKEDKRYLAENFIAFFNRDYRKVAELHVDSGWVPAETNVEEFEFAIRTVCEPIFQKPLAEISFGHVLVNLFNTARRFNMQVQPQLVLLQKTLLYVEGLGRQLYPQLDLWKTAKPFLEQWVKDQVGPMAVLKNIQANLPFWGEKLPELPDLIYNSLKNQHKNANQPIIRNEIELKPLLLGLLACSSLVIASIFYVSANQPFAIGSFIFAAICFVCAWNKAK
ncbi:ubiquinone biosynthesis regulatory protein kinase UbiB [Pseudoalteromonas tunicata]|uniref:ubiquinone biosynthesis regulatory protein kinase UbiB n=1 Tax=Pseudoalteromonas tunicata TaxID=314281 RepID=UPI000324DEC5|nr:ubiquinone biosynthesis regulatory protein kinase UbiB [Pseudoalteromonas tunicata]ATC96244.1 ubiquinone biosynthesis protein [Pseudoalteromonas tunicata]AXT31757.1 ubiquinone biosynthesis regulatory protein kinase UbiB [Pseudoalteromonas tunicata]